MDKVFRLSGSVVTSNGERVRDLPLAVVAQGRPADIRLGSGKTDELGEFRISFTSREFNLHRRFFRRRHPRIVLVFSVECEGKLQNVCRYTAILDFERNTSIDAGEIRIDNWEPLPAERRWRDVQPGLAEGVRLDVDRELVYACLQEVAPKVERLTGWRGLLEDLEIAVTNNYRKSVFRLVGELGVATSFWDRTALRLLFKMFMAQYEPLSQVLVVHQRPCARCNLDGLKVILGHELVHVGQFKHSPTIVRQYRESLQWLRRTMEDTKLTFREMVENLDYSLHQDFMSQIEGYATYIQRYLERYYNCAEIVPPRTLLPRTVLRLISFVIPDLNELFRVKSEQYQGGVEVFERLDNGHGPVPFR